MHFPNQSYQTGNTLCTVLIVTKETENETALISWTSWRQLFRWMRLYGEKTQQLRGKL